jgi:pimeloyl-ACP methyl ester carboxylesterase
MSTEAIYKSAAGQAAIAALYERVLDQWPVPADRLLLPTRHGETFVLRWGNPAGRPLVLLHGSGSNSATWLGDATAYASPFQVYAVDLPGEPGKSAPTRFSWDGPAFNEWLTDVLDQLGLSTVNLGGMSLGAWAVINFASAHPERVSHAILIVPSGICQPRLGFVARMIGYALLGARGRALMKEYLFADLEMSPELDEFLTLTGEHFNYRTGAPPLFTDAQLRRLTMPALFLAGRHDRLLDTTKTAARLAQLLPDLTVRIDEGSGHATVHTAGAVIEFLTAEPARVYA